MNDDDADDTDDEDYDDDMKLKTNVTWNIGFHRRKRGCYFCVFMVDPEAPWDGKLYMQQ